MHRTIRQAWDVKTSTGQVDKHLTRRVNQNKKKYKTLPGLLDFAGITRLCRNYYTLPETNHEKMSTIIKPRKSLFCDADLIKFGFDTWKLDPSISI